MIAHSADSLTHVELIWIDKQIEHWIRFGHEIAEQILDRRRRNCSALRRTGTSPMSGWAGNGFGTIVSRIDICAPSSRSTHSTVPYVRPGGSSCCAFRVGRRSSECCKRSMPSTRSASIPLRPVPIIGGTSRTGWPPARRRAHTRGSATPHGSSDRSSNDNSPAERACTCRFFSRGRRAHRIGKNPDPADVERECQRSNRPLHRASAWSPPCRRAGCHHAARASRELSR